MLSERSCIRTGFCTRDRKRRLYGVTAFSADNVWAVGFYDNGIGSPGYTLVEHWTGKKWHLISAPNTGSNNNVLGSVTTIPFGFFGVGSALGLVTFIVWIVLVVAACRGRYFKLPLFGDYAEQYANRPRR